MIDTELRYAHHEAGHAIACDHFDVAVSAIQLPTDDGDGFCEHDPIEPRHGLVVTLAGGQAERVFVDDYDPLLYLPAAAADESRAVRIAEELASPDRWGPDAEQVLDDGRKAATALVYARLDAIAALARSLVANGGSLGGSEASEAIAAARAGRTWLRSSRVPSRLALAAERSARNVRRARPGMTLGELAAGAPLPLLGRYAYAERHRRPFA